ncbi:hypothetical protein [Rhodospirillum rubrum]|uniref:FlgN n=1 Tax=Rhodospirillum rubrum (strain ATCC 11170 / ATH 1.1.1 / DSM 467 / LMG 4362 / NCIMB 8255 / S1) TaxID=269796 RepID=Q2RRB5_RHORT|nr:hypothetical protein [Rhodospirillum rubrum]ABC23330.1 hypothetical protein Rru_A2530 [Rhodospirillum rubrum ATCC 11170]AEO49063.1 hypothetical protein F11_12995 [Rhodospirillum rubrum F11]MBK5954973.1 hypothetical protein [Rhodospirillum rubrum]QXG79303.1 hypothetical protein KUL73_13060 [Rhodospirillum rubrum]HAQ01276.1 hypothetical protein [Rhodospirillum rubrum]
MTTSDPSPFPADVTALAADRALLAEYTSVLGELTRIAESERMILRSRDGEISPPMAARQERLGERYAALTIGLKARARALYGASLLDPAQMERKIVYLVTLMKENQRLMNARKAATALRVEVVMRAIAEREAASALGAPANEDGAEDLGEEDATPGDRPARGASSTLQRL